MIERILTIGAYGFDQERFLKRLQDAEADLFIDIRARRGMRGAAYAFANAARLRASLADAGIRYTHFKELAPTADMRAAQQDADDAAHIAKRVRTGLSPSFIEAYNRQRMEEFDAQAFVDSCCTDARRPVFFCVEREPAACHRSLVAQRLGEQLRLPVEHLMP